MKLIVPAALALMLGACAHECNCAPPPAETVDTFETIDLDAAEPEEVVVEETVVEEVVVEEPAPLVEEVEAIVEIETAPTMTIETDENGTSRRVVTRRLVDSFEEAGTPTAPAMDGSAIDDPLLSETPRVLEDTTFDTPSIPDAVEAIEDVVEDAVDAVDEAVDGGSGVGNG